MLGVFLDTETNGLNSEIHTILEIAYKIVDLTNGELKEEYQTIITKPLEVWKKSDPGSLKINGFTWDEVSLGTPSAIVAKHIIDSFAKHPIVRKKAVFICQNPSFDRAFFSKLINSDEQESLNWPYHWLDLASMFWAISVDRAKRKEDKLPWEIGYSKDSIAAHYHLPPEQKPHRAMNGVNHLLLCYEAVVGFPKAVR